MSKKNLYTFGSGNWITVTIRITKKQHKQLIISCNKRKLGKAKLIRAVLIKNKVIKMNKEKQFPGSVVY